MLSLEHLHADALLWVLIATATSIVSLRVGERLARAYVHRVSQRALAHASAIVERPGAPSDALSEVREGAASVQGNRSTP